MKNQQLTARCEPDIVDRVDQLAEEASKITLGQKIDRGGMVRALVLLALPLMEARVRTDVAAAKVRAAVDKLGAGVRVAVRGQKRKATSGKRGAK